MILKKRTQRIDYNYKIIMIKHVSYKIQNAIQIELFGAKKSIKIAVAWFTNELLLHPLVLKLQTGVSVEIILNDDNINKGGESSLDFNPPKRKVSEL